LASNVSGRSESASEPSSTTISGNSTTNSLGVSPDHLGVVTDIITTNGRAVGESASWNEFGLFVEEEADESVKGSSGSGSHTDVFTLTIVRVD